MFTVSGSIKDLQIDYCFKLFKAAPKNDLMFIEGTSIIKYVGK